MMKIRFMSFPRFFISAILLLVISACSEPNADGNKSISLHVYKQASCKCCGKWVGQMEMSGFDVNVKNLQSLTPIKSKYGIRSLHQSCHTAVAEGFVFEGHIPAEVIKRFLDNKPEHAIGLSVPGMPIGSPGMEMGSRTETYNVLQLNSDGSTQVYARVTGNNVLSYENETTKDIYVRSDGA